jgi:hypothetical protein
MDVSTPTGYGRRRPLFPGRAVHLLDIENLTASSRPSTSDVATVMTLYRTLVPIGPMDQFIVAVNHNALVQAGIAFRGVQLLARSGPDGADRALVETAYGDRLEQRFDRVVVGSGDGYFTELVSWLTAAGVRVTVVSRRGSLSWRLYAAAPDTVAFDPPAATAA